jgi:hypothetical protein
MFNKGSYCIKVRMLRYSAILGVCLLTNVFAAGGWKLFWSGPPCGRCAVQQ